LISVRSLQRREKVIRAGSFGCRLLAPFLGSSLLLAMSTLFLLLELLFSTVGALCHGSREEGAF
jgi:hypothetical protein